MTRNMTEIRLPHEIRLIAAVSRLVDLHQSRREGGGVYVPDIPEKGGYYLTLALVLIECLREVELDRGIGAVSISELIGMVRKRVLEATTEDIEYCVANLRAEREIHYGVENASGRLDFARTWDTTPLLAVAEGFGQVQLTENARLLLRVASLRDSWLYSDLDADRLIKAIERGQFEDIPVFCRAMTLDLATKGKQLSGVMERPSLSELRELLLREGPIIAESLATATETIRNAIDLIFDARSRKSFAGWASRYQNEAGENPPFSLGNLQADMELVLQNAEALSRRFVRFVDQAQRVRSEGAERIRFLEIADHLVRTAKHGDEARLEALLKQVLPWGGDERLFHPLSLVGAVDFVEQQPESVLRTTGYTVNPEDAQHNSRFQEFVRRNREMIVSRLREGPAHFSEILRMGGFDLLPEETPLDFFGIYAAPGTIEDKETRIIVGLNGANMRIEFGERLVTGSDPLMLLEEGIR